MQIQRTLQAQQAQSNPLATQSQHIHNGEPSYNSMNRPLHEDDNNHIGLNLNRQQSLYASQISKVEFPKFDDSQLKDLVYKCKQVFSLDKIALEAKVKLASMHVYRIAL